MHFRLAAESDRGLVESLWDYCFEHREDPFFQWYFNHFYQPENVLMGFEGDDMACLTHLNPYTLCLRGKAVDIAVHKIPAAEQRWLKMVCSSQYHRSFRYELLLQIFF